MSGIRSGHVRVLMPGGTGSDYPDPLAHGRPDRACCAGYGTERTG